MSRKHRPRPLLVAAAGLSLVVIAANCSESDQSSGGEGGAGGSDNSVTGPSTSTSLVNTFAPANSGVGGATASAGGDNGGAGGDGGSAGDGSGGR